MRARDTRDPTRSARAPVGQDVPTSMLARAGTSMYVSGSGQLGSRCPRGGIHWFQAGRESWVTTTHVMTGQSVSAGVLNQRRRRDGNRRRRKAMNAVACARLAYASGVAGRQLLRSRLDEFLDGESRVADSRHTWVVNGYGKWRSFLVGRITWRSRLGEGPVAGPRQSPGDGFRWHFSWSAAV
jgi:hypothetical protein